MTETDPDIRPGPAHRIPSPWVVFCATLTLFAGLNLWSFRDFSQTALCGGAAGFPFEYYSVASMTGTVSFDPWILFANIAIGLAAAIGLSYLMRDGWREFWHWIRTAGVEYTPQSEPETDAADCA